MNDKIIENVRKFVARQTEQGKVVKSYVAKSNPTNYFNKLGIGVGLNKNKEIYFESSTKIFI